MSVLRQCEWKGTDESDSTKGELTGVEVQWERIYEAKDRALEQLRNFSFCYGRETKGSKAFADITAESILYL